MSFDAEKIQQIINYRFKNVKLLKVAFTHKSYHGENCWENNERLEFLGDSLLGFIVAEYLYKQKRMKNEGKMTQTKQRYVSTYPLSVAIKSMGLQNFIIQGESMNNTAASNDRLLENLFEALLAAIYLDGGFEEAKKFVDGNLLNEAQSKSENTEDYKSQLQVYTQAKKMGTPTYELVDKTGPEHNPLFTIAVSVAGKVVAVGSGGNKSVASQDAARRAIKKLFR